MRRFIVCLSNDLISYSSNSFLLWNAFLFWSIKFSVISLCPNCTYVFYTADYSMTSRLFRRNFCIAELIVQRRFEWGTEPLFLIFWWSVWFVTLRNVFKISLKNRAGKGANARSLILNVYILTIKDVSPERSARLHGGFNNQPTSSVYISATSLGSRSYCEFRTPCQYPRLEFESAWYRYWIPFLGQEVH